MKCRDIYYVEHFYGFFRIITNLKKCNDDQSTWFQAEDLRHPEATKYMIDYHHEDMTLNDLKFRRAYWVGRINRCIEKIWTAILKNLQ